MRVGVSMGVSSVSIGTGVQGTVCFRSRFSQDIWNKNMFTLAVLPGKAIFTRGL